MFDDVRQPAIHVYGDQLLRHSYCECTSNREELMNSYVCACYQCGTYFFPEEIKFWTKRDSAVCPHCGWITVLPEAAHLPLTPEHLARMKKRYCKPS